MHVRIEAEAPLPALPGPPCLPCSLDVLCVRSRVASRCGLPRAILGCLRDNGVALATLEADTVEASQREHLMAGA